jgi:hypothetical protein
MTIDYLKPGSDSHLRKNLKGSAGEEKKRKKKS